MKATYYKVTATNSGVYSLHTDKHVAEAELSNLIQNGKPAKLETVTDDTPIETEKEENELSNAANLLDIYVDNDGFIYENYTQKAIDAIVNDGLNIESTEVKNHIRNAVNCAAWQVKKYDGLTPTAKDIEHATRLFTDYILECAQYQIETA